MHIGPRAWQISSHGCLLVGKPYGCFLSVGSLCTPGLWHLWAWFSLIIPFSLPGKNCLALSWSQSYLLCVIQLLCKWIPCLLLLEGIRSSPEDVIIPVKWKNSHCFPNGSPHKTPSINYQVLCRYNCPVIAWAHVVTRCVYKSLAVQ